MPPKKNTASSFEYQKDDIVAITADFGYYQVENVLGMVTGEYNSYFNNKAQKQYEVKLFFIKQSLTFEYCFETEMKLVYR